MNSDALYVFVLIAIASALFASGRLRMDVIALLVVLALMLGGILTEREALSGFGNPVVLIVAGLLVVGEMLTRTGIAFAIGNWMARVSGDSEVRLLVLLMLAAGLLGSVMSSTAVVAILIPVVVNVAGNTSVNVSRLLLPMSYGALISGMLTLIATTPNLVASGELGQAGYEPFKFFSFTPIGAVVLLAGIAYMLVIGRHLLPGDKVVPPKPAATSLRDLIGDFDLLARFHRFRVPVRSPLVGRTIRESGLSSHDARVVVLERTGRFGLSSIAEPGPNHTIRPGDILVIQADTSNAVQVEHESDLERLRISHADRQRWVRDVGLATVLIHPESRLIGKTLHEAEFRSRFGLQVLAVRRSGRVLTRFLDEKLRLGDALLVLGPWKKIGQLRYNVHDYVVLTLPAELDQVAPARRKAPVAALILLGMVTITVLEIVSVVAAVLMAGLAAVFTRCLTMEEGYRSIHWSSVVLIAAMLPVADALQKTGGVEIIVDGLVSSVGEAGPYFMMTGLFFLTAVLGMFLSNTATAVLMAPIAISAAEALGVAPYAFVMTVAIAASAAYVTPVSSPIVTLVVAPGKYRFIDFVKVGSPLLLISWVVTMVVTPLLFAF
ncbi:MAG: SLC13 family permease [Gemmatimonadota bacterium]|nr:MAG: SLC13 family permease [Gemmatimonadota bacterium]